MNIVLDRNSSVSLKAQIVEYFKTQIRLGVFYSGMRLPSVRSLAAQINVNPSTIREAFNDLSSLDLVEGQAGRGTFVRAGVGPTGFVGTKLDVERDDNLRDFVYSTIVAPVSGDILSLDQQVPTPDILPLADLEKASRHIWNRNNRSLYRYGHPQGLLPLRQQFARLLAWRGITRAGPSDLLLTGGVVQSLFLCLTVLCRKRDTVIVEKPSWSVALAMLEQLGLRPEPVPITTEGMDVDSVAQILRSRRVGAILTVPCGHNPTGITSSPAQRQDLVRIAKYHGVPIIEDDSYGLLGLGRPEAPALAAHDSDGATVFHMMGTSKTLGPAVRLGCLMPPSRYLERLLVAKQNLDLHTGQLAQYVTERYLAMDRFEPYLMRATELYAGMRNDRVAVVREILGPDVHVKTPMGGFALWLRLPYGLSARTVVSRAYRERVFATPGPCFFLRDAQEEGDRYIRLSYTVPDASRFRQGIEVLGRAIAES